MALDDLQSQPVMPSEAPVVAVETAVAPVSTPVAPTATPDGSDDAQARARAMGWAPKEEFRGDPERWKDADTFVAEAEQNMPVMRERLRDATRRISEFEQKQERQRREFADHVARVERMSVTALERQRDQIVGSYEAAKRQAVEVGDLNRYDQLKHDEAQSLKHFDTTARQAAAPPATQQPGGAQRQFTPDEMATVGEWVGKNGWFERDLELNAVAQARHIALLREKPGLSMSDNLATVEKYVRNKFPEKFGIPDGELGSAPVEGGGRRAVNPPRQKGAADLPPEIRKVGERFVAQKLFKDINEYARDFWSQE